MVIAACNASTDVSAELPFVGIWDLVVAGFVASTVASSKSNDAAFDLSDLRTKLASSGVSPVSRKARDDRQDGGHRHDSSLAFNNLNNVSQRLKSLCFGNLLA